MIRCTPKRRHVFYLFIFFSTLVKLRILTGKMYPKIKLQRLRKIRILTFGSLVHQINSFHSRDSKTGTNFPKKKVITGKTPLFVIGPFCSRHSICLNIGFWQSNLEWKWCVFNLTGFNEKTVTVVFWKRFSFSRKFVSKLKYWKRSKLSPIVT